MLYSEYMKHLGPVAIAEAMQRVLVAERDAETGLDAARVAAERQRGAAHEAARQIRQRTSERIRRLQIACTRWTAAEEERLRQLAARSETGRPPLDDRLLDQAVARLVAKLTGAGDDGAG